MQLPLPRRPDCIVETHWRFSSLPTWPSISAVRAFLHGIARPFNWPVQGRSAEQAKGDGFADFQRRHELGR